MAIDRGIHFPSTFTEWYRERPFLVAFVVSIVVHALLIAFMPGFRSVPVDVPQVLEVQIAPQETTPPPKVVEKPVMPPKPVERTPEPVQPPPEPQPMVKQPPPPEPQPVVKQPPPEPPPAPRTNIIQSPRAEPKPEFVVPKPELRPEPKAEPKLESRPEPRIEPKPEPPPVARVEPRPEPRPTPTLEPRPEPRPQPKIEPKAEIVPDARPVPRDVPPPTLPQQQAQPVAPSPPVAASVPAPAVAPPPSVSAPPPPKPLPQQASEARDNQLLATYGASISKEIKRFQKYPPPAQRRGWEGTVEVLLQIAADGKVTSVTVGKSSGHAMLDEEAVNMIHRAMPLPEPPPDLRGQPRVVTVPIVFKLQNS